MSFKKPVKDKMIFFRASSELKEDLKALSEFYELPISDLLRRLIKKAVKRVKEIEKRGDHE